jgi:hypothetical protein
MWRLSRVPTYDKEIMPSGTRHQIASHFWPHPYASLDHRVGDTRIVTSSATPARRHF